MDAATQMFFTLSLGFGALIAFASYMPEKNNCTRDAYTVVLINCGTSIFAGVVVFSILGYRELKTGIDATKVAALFQYLSYFWLTFRCKLFQLFISYALLIQCGLFLVERLGSWLGFHDILRCVVADGRIAFLGNLVLHDAHFAWN